MRCSSKVVQSLCLQTDFAGLEIELYSLIQPIWPWILTAFRKKLADMQEYTNGFKY